MKKGWFSLGLGLVLLLPVSARADDLQAGAAFTAFQLPRGTPLAGYSRRKGHPSQGTHDPVGVRALALHGAGASVVIASCDLLMIDEELHDAIVQRAQERGLPADFLVLVAATHTHSGPGAYGRHFGEKISMGHFDPEVQAVIINAAAEAIVNAAAKLQPVRASFSSIETQGLAKNRVQDNGLVDNTLRVAAFYPAGESRDPVAVILNFSAHPTSLGASNMLFSADYPGVARQQIESAFPGAVCLFLAGSVGDQAPIKQGNGFETAERIGSALAVAAKQALAQMQPKSTDALYAVRTVQPLGKPRVRINKTALPGWLSRRLVDDDGTLTAIAIGDIVLAGVPCDWSAELGARVHQAAETAGFHSMVVGFADDYIGYCMSPDVYETGAYEAAMAFNGPNTGVQLADALAAMIRSIAGEPGDEKDAR